MSDERLTVDDCTRAGFCPSGIRRWCHANGVDLKGFLKNGMPIEQAKAMNDGLVNRALDMKEKASGR